MVTSDTSVQRYPVSQGAATIMDMHFLIERLEALVANARRVPFGGMVLIDEQELLELIDHMQNTEPNELNQARRVLQEREQIISQTQDEAEKIITMARDRAAYLLSQDGLMLEAKAHAEQLLADARHEAETLRAEAERYVSSLLLSLKDTLSKNLAQVEAGLNELGSA
jgi:hypothetical protein